MTAWTQAGSLTSDRLQLRQRSSPQQQQQRSKGKTKDSSSLKSKEVQELEQILQGLREDKDTKNPAGGCFCQARTHSLSKYTPNCLNCGLVLCTLQLPFHLCPHCFKPLVDPSSRSTLISQVGEELQQVLQKEEDDRVRSQQEREQAQGAFPTLAASTGTAEPRKSTQPRNVLSVNSKTGKIMMATYSTPSVSPGQTRQREKEKEEVRQRPPPTEVDYVKGKILESTSWKNLRHEVMYVPERIPDTEGVQNKKTKKKT